MLPLIDEEGKVIGVAPRERVPQGPGQAPPRRPSPDSGRAAGGMYLQKRAADKDTQPGKWDSAVGGHVSVGEDLDTRPDARAARGARRHQARPRGLRRPRRAHTALPLGQRTSSPSWCSRFIVTYGGPFAPDGKEVTEGRFWSFAEIRANLGKGLFTPNFEHEYGLIERAAAEAAKARSGGGDASAIPRAPPPGPALSKTARPRAEKA